MFFIIWHATHTSGHFQSQARQRCLTQVTFRWKDYAHGSRQRTMASWREFLRRFLLPRAAACFVAHPLLRIPCESAANPTTATLPTVAGGHLASEPPHRRPERRSYRFLVVSALRWRMLLIEKFTAQEIRWKSAEASHFVDSSYQALYGESSVCFGTHTGVCLSRENRKNRQPYLWQPVENLIRTKLLAQSSKLDASPVGNQLRPRSQEPKFKPIDGPRPPQTQRLRSNAPIESAPGSYAEPLLLCLPGHSD